MKKRIINSIKILLWLFLLSSVYANTNTDENIKVKNILSVLTADLNKDGQFDRIVLGLNEEDEDATLYIYLSSAGLMKLAIQKDDFIAFGHSWGTLPVLSINKSGSLIITSKNQSAGVDHWSETLTVSYRNKQLLVSGYRYFSKNKPHCDVNLLTGRGYINKKSFKFPANKIALDNWTRDDIPKPCKPHSEQFDISLPWKSQSEFKFNIAPNKPVFMKLNGKTLTARFGTNKNSVPVFDFNDLDEDRFRLVARDYNFDGFTDFTVETGIGYSGLNVFADLFLYDKDSGRFIKSLSINLAALSLKDNRKELSFSTKDGPYWYHDVYHFNGVKAWLYKQSVVLGENIPNLALKMTINGNVIGGTTRGSISEKTYLFNHPKQAAKTKMYLIEGDKVHIIAAKKIADGARWLLVRFKGKRQIEKWIYLNKFIPFR